MARAEAAWQRTLDLAGDDPAPWMQRAHWYTGRGELAKAEADWQHAVELAGADPSVSIQRGRWFAARGMQEKADADFAKAASLTSKELNRFLAAGWWVAGPYPPRLEQCCPPEVDPDPSRPVYTINPTTGLSDQPVAWLSVATGLAGRVQPGPRFAASVNSSHYALAYVYSPDERTALLRIAGGDPLLPHDHEPTRPTTWDEVVRADPDVVLVAPCGFGVERTVAELHRLPVLRALRAFREGRVHVLDGNAYFNRPGPRLVDSAEIAAAALHPVELGDHFVRRGEGRVWSAGPRA